MTSKKKEAIGSTSSPREHTRRDVSPEKLDIQMESSEPDKSQPLKRKKAAKETKKEKKKKIRVHKPKSTSDKKNFSLEGHTLGTESQKLIAEFQAEERGELKKVTKQDEKSFGFIVNIKTKEVGIPKNVEGMIGDLWTAEVLRVSYKLDLKTVASPGIVEKFPSREDDPFWKGYFSELSLETKVSEISFHKDSPYANGKHCARFELLKSCLSSENQPFIRNIPDEIRGKKAIPSLLSRMIAVRFKEDVRKSALSFIHGLTAIVASFLEFGVQKIDFKSFLPTFSDIMHNCKRKSVEVKGKGKRATQRVKALNPTKPSQLKSVAPYERDAIREIYEGPWRSINDEKETYETSVDFLDIDRSELQERLRKMVNLQWRAKQTVLNLTRKRMVTKRNDAQLDRKTQISETQRELSRVKDKASYHEFCKWEKRISIFPVGPYKVKTVEYTSFQAYLRTAEGMERYPRSVELLSIFDEAHISERTSKTSVSESKTKDPPVNANRYLELSEEDGGGK